MSGPAAGVASRLQKQNKWPFRKSCAWCAGRQGKELRSVQARRAAVTNGGPAPAPPIPQWGFADPLRPGTTARSGRASLGPHHPLHPAEQRVPGTPAGLPRKVASSSPRRPALASWLRPRMRGMGAFGLVVWQPQTARVRRAHHPPLPGTINLVCAPREHVRLPGHHMPALMGAMREQGGLAWRPRLSAQKKRGGRRAGGLPLLFQPVASLI